MRIDEKDYTFDELADVSKEGGFEAACVLITMEKHPERFEKHIRPMIKAENLDVFKLLMSKGKIFDVYNRLDDKKENIWVELVENRQFDFLERIVNLYSKKPYNIRQMSLLKKALDTAKTGDTKEDLQIKRLSSKAEDIQKKLIRASAMSLGSVKIGSSDEKTDFPDIIFTSYGENTYHFQGIKIADIRSNGRVSVLLEKMIHAKKAQMIEDLVSEKEKNDWIMRNFSDEALENGSMSDVMNSEIPLNSTETVEKIKEMSSDFENLYKEEFEKADDLQCLFGKIMRTNHAALLRSFALRGGRIALQKNEGQEIDVVTDKKTISMKRVTYANLYKGLIQDFDEHSVFSNSPFFKSVEKYMMENDQIARGENVKALLPFLADKSMASMDALPEYLQGALDIVDAYSEKMVKKDVEGGFRIFAELGKPVVPLTEENIKNRMNRILRQSRMNINGRDFDRE